MFATFEMSAKKGENSSIRGSPKNFSDHFRSKNVDSSEISARGFLLAIFRLFTKMKFGKIYLKAMTYSFTAENSIF